MADKFTAQNLFSALQRAIQDRLSAGLGEWYNIPEGVVSIAEDQADVETEIDQRTAKVGLCLILIISKVARGAAKGQRDLTIQLSGFENVIINRANSGTRVALVDVLAAADGLLDDWEPTLDAVTLGFTPLQFEDQIPVALGSKDSPLVERGLNLSTSVLLTISQ